MGIFDSNSDEEVKISPNKSETESSTNESRLKSEVESEIVDGENSSEKSSSRGHDIMERSRESNSANTSQESGVSLEDIHRQNKRIIELLEEISGDSFSTDGESKNNEDDIAGDLNGVL